MTPEERRQAVYMLAGIVQSARLILDIKLKQLRPDQPTGTKCDPLVTSLTLVDGALCDAEQGLKTIAKWEAE